jgi:hypothetical protein
MEPWLEVCLTILVLLFYVSIGCVILWSSLKKEHISRLSICLSLLLAGVGLYFICGEIRSSEGFKSWGGLIWTLVFLAKGIIEWVRRGKGRKP